MAGTYAVNLAKPIKSVKILNDYPGDIESSTTGAMNPSEREGLKAQKKLYNEVCRTLQGVTSKLNQFYDEVFASHKEEIARLSVEIARKILMQKAEDGDYEIETIIREALKNAPTHQDLVIRLNPHDLTACQKAQQNDGSETLAGIKFVADQSIGRAECVLESPKGIIELLIDEHLEQIGKALKKAE